MTKKKVLTAILAGAMALSMAVPALAASSTETKDATVKAIPHKEPTGKCGKIGA